MSLAQNPQYSLMSANVRRRRPGEPQDLLVGHRDAEQVAVGEPAEARGLGRAPRARGVRRSRRPPWNRRRVGRSPSTRAGPRASAVPRRIRVPSRTTQCVYSFMVPPFVARNYRSRALDARGSHAA